MADHPSDASLLNRFVNGREEAAFAAVVRRHAPLVRAACLKVLGSEQDAEDVAQATFLVLALKAPHVAWADSVGAWLCAVARRLSLHARASGLRRLRLERSLGTLIGATGALPEELHPSADPQVEIARRDLRRVIEQELNRLPDKYRAPVVLCDMEGLTHEEAARRLGLPTGSMSRRLGRARSLLRQRLATRGLPLAVGLLVGLAAAALGPWTRPGNPRATLPAVPRLTLASVHDSPDDAHALGDWLHAVARDGYVDPDAPETHRAVRQADELARALGGSDHGPIGTFWATATTSLGDAAGALSVAAHDRDAPGLLAAARRLNARCTQCHLVYTE